jgi:hypothetical protein
MTKLERLEAHERYHCEALREVLKGRAGAGPLLRELLRSDIAIIRALRLAMRQSVGAREAAMECAERVAEARREQRRSIEVALRPAYEQLAHSAGHLMLASAVDGIMGTTAAALRAAYVQGARDMRDRAVGVAHAHVGLCASALFFEKAGAIDSVASEIEALDLDRAPRVASPSAWVPRALRNAR